MQLRPGAAGPTGVKASISFRCQCDGARHLAVKLEAGAFLYPKLRDAQRVTVRDRRGRARGIPFDVDGSKPLLVPIPALPADKVVRMTIDLPDAVSPAAVGSTDERVLGLSLRSLEIIEDLAGKDDTHN